MVMDSEIQKFYDDAKIFITGSTGLVGKILLEKLLRSTSTSTIYLLIREKNGGNIQSRLDELFDDIIFEKVKKEDPNFRSKITGVSGDCAIFGLGLSTHDRIKLIDDVEVVFHVAAILDFDEKLKRSYATNVAGTIDLLELCKQMKKLKSVIHVSSAYAHCILKEIKEEFYETPLSYEEIGAILNKLEDEEIGKITRKILGDWPNVYVFTKALAESAVKEKGSGLPLGVFRPSIVTSTYKEPLEGWINNFSGPTGICAGALSGALHTLHCDESVTANIVPVDTCVAALIASAWDVATSNIERVGDNIPIYNYVSSIENPVTWEEFNLLSYLHGTKNPLNQSIWAITFKTTKSSFLNKLYQFVYHYIPAVSLDLIYLATLQKPKMLAFYGQVHHFSSVLAYFCTKEWTYTNENVVKMWNRMGKTDQKIFPFSINNIMWTMYFKNYVKGIKKYLFKESTENMDGAKTKQKRLIMAHVFLKYTLLYATARILCSQTYGLLMNLANFGDDDNSNGVDCDVAKIRHVFSRKKRANEFAFICTKPKLNYCLNKKLVCLYM